MLTALLIALPLVASLFLFAIPGNGSRNLAVGVSALQLLITLALVFTAGSPAAPKYVLDLPWIPSLGIHFHVGMDGISLVLVLLTNLLVPFILLSSGAESARPSSFYALTLLMQSALVGVFTAQDGFLFYIFWELALLPIWFIVMMWSSGENARTPLKFFVYTLTGSLLMLVGLVVVYLHTPGAHSFDLQVLCATGSHLSAETQSWVFWLLFLAFAIKMPIFPLHTWQPDTYTEAPVQGTMLLSGIMLKMGTYGVMRWLLPVVPLGAAQWSALAIGLAVTGIVYGACIALVQTDFKRLIAYSSISHVGLMAAGLMAANVQAFQGALFQMVSHGISVFCLFYIIDRIEARTGTRELSALGGVRSQAPGFAAIFLVVTLGAVALPLTNGFVGEFLLLAGLYQWSAAATAVAGLTVVLGAVYMLRAYQRTMLGEAGKSTGIFAELSSHERLVLYPMVALIIALGVYPKPLLDISAPAVEQLLSLVHPR